MANHARERLAISTGLRRALARNEFSLRYQPIVGLESENTLAVESLLRWDHPQFGVLTPDRFVPMAEENGLIVETGCWVIRQACRDLVDLESTDGQPLQVSVNVSVRQLLDPQFGERVERILAEEGFPTERLVLEITESTALTDSPAISAAINRLKAMGVRLALDDFGTGYSSLAVAHGFPLDFLKIDKVFIQSADRSLARAIVAIAQSLGLRTVAEGIETEQQRIESLEIGCDLGQGYAFSEPLERQQLREWLAAQLNRRTSPTPR
jgi:diguanylate cyclase